MWRNWLVVLVLAGLAPLGSAQIGAGQSARQRAVTWSNLTSGADSQANQFSTFVIGDQNALNNYWNQTFGSLRGVPTNVVWSRELVAAVNLGPRNRNGGGVIIRDVSKVSTLEVQVTWSERVPPAWADTKPAKLSPYALIRMNRVAAQKITFAQGPNMVTPLAVLNAQGIGVRSGGYYDVPWIPYGSGGLCQFTDFYSGVIVDAPAFGVYWSTAFGPGIDFPNDVDFSSEQLVVLHLGRRPTTGYAAVIQGLKWISSTSVQVEWYEQTPAPGMMQAQHVTSPYAMVRIPRGNIQVTFKKIAPPAAGRG